jgi:hypothetical protein
MSVIIWGFAFYKSSGTEFVSIDFAEESYELSKRFAVIISFFFTLISGAFLNHKIKKHLFSFEPNNLFWFFYMLIFSVELTNSSFLSYDVVAVLLIFLVSYLLLFAEPKNIENHVFNASFIIGLLALHNLFFVIFLVLLFHNLGTSKRIGFKELTLIITGFFVPILIVFAFSFITENYSIINSIFNFQFSLPKVTWKYILILLFFLYLSFVGYKSVVTKRSGIDISTLRLTKNLLIYLLISILLSLLSIFSLPQHYILFLLTLPLSLFLSFYFANTTFKWKEIIFIATIAFTFLLR